MKSAAWVRAQLVRVETEMADWEPPRRVQKAEEYVERLNQLLPHIRLLNVDDLLLSDGNFFLVNDFPGFSKDELSPSGDTVLDLPYSALRLIVRALRKSFPDNERLNALHPRVWKAAVSLYERGYRGSAILEAYKAVNARVRELTESQGSDRDGKALMGYALNASNCRRSRNSLPDERDVQVIPQPRVHGMPHPAGVKVPATGLLA